MNSQILKVAAYVLVGVGVVCLAVSFLVASLSWLTWPAIGAAGLGLGASYLSHK